MPPDKDWQFHATQADAQDQDWQAAEYAEEPKDGGNPMTLPTVPVAFPSDWSYETSVAYVEEIITQIEDGEMDLADVFEQFASAVKHLRQCETFLQQQKQRMDVLIETLTDDQADF
jgi:exodeoxyribonuclease VII small subunit